jgi:hypothetical protein
MKMILALLMFGLALPSDAETILDNVGRFDDSVASAKKHYETEGPLAQQTFAQSAHPPD